MLKLRKSVVAATVLGTAVVGGGAAYAYVVTSGHGHGTTTVASPALSMAVTPAVSSNLAPGTAVPLPVYVQNTGQAKIQISSVYVTIPPTETCNDTIVVSQQPTVNPIVIPANGTATIDGASITMLDSDTVDQTACMGNTIDIDVSVNHG